MPSNNIEINQFIKRTIHPQEKDKISAFWSSVLPKKINESGFHPEAGVKKGLTVILDAHTDLIKVHKMSMWIIVDEITTGIFTFRHLQYEKTFRDS